VGRGQLTKAGRSQSTDSLAKIAAEMEELFEREVELLKSDADLTSDQIAKYEKTAARIAELFSKLRKLR